MEQPNRFQKLVAQAKQHIKEIAASDARKQVEAGEAILIDVREENDWSEGHAQGGRNLSRGLIELEIEEQSSGFEDADHLLLRRREPFRARGGESAKDGI